VTLAKWALSSLTNIGIVIGIAVLFLFSFAGTVYLALRSPEVKVPSVVGKDRMAGESALRDVGLNTRVRATRPSSESPDTILSQLPRAGEIVKVGQTVAVDVSRAAKTGEYVPAAPVADQPRDASSQQGNRNTAESPDENDNQNRRKHNKNANSNSKNANSGNGNSNGNTANRVVNRNTANLAAGNHNVNAVQNVNAGNRNSSLNRNANTGNLNKRAPATSTPFPPNPNSNRRTP
jgi:hypothetical protein